MVSSLLVDSITHPDTVLRDFANGLKDADDLPARVSKYFADIFASDNAFKEITVLTTNTEALRPKSLVRFDAMIQDTACSPEIYLSKNMNGDCGGWGLIEHDTAADENSPVDYSLLRECSIVWAVSIPGESAWCTESASSGKAASANTPQPHKYPLPSTAHVGAQLKIYDTALSETLRTTDLHSFVGILAFEPWHSQSENVAPVLVPTIHVLFSRKIPSTVVPRAFPEQFESSVDDVRENLISWIADEGLSGDKLAAEFVLLSLISKVQSRTPPILPLSLDLAGFGSSESGNPRLPYVLSHLVPMLAVVPLSLNVVNSTPFVPESKEEDLHSGWLQLPKGSTCVVSELSLEEGTISSKGIGNLRSLQDTMANQTLDYVFPFSQFSFDTDIVFIILTAGKKSPFFKAQHHVPLKNAGANGFYSPDASAIQLPSPQMLTEYRKLIGGAKIGSVTLDEKTATFIQEDFVKERQAGSTKDAGKADVVTSDDLIIRMMVAKLLAASYHQPEVTKEMWERAKDLDGQRKARLG